MSTCCECLFSRRRAVNGAKGSEPQLQCHRSPPELKPVPQQNGGMSLISFWPPIDENEWCGEFADDPAGRRQ